MYFRPVVAPRALGVSDTFADIGHRSLSICHGLNFCTGNVFYEQGAELRRHPAQ